MIFSLVFYAWGEPVYILLMLFVSFSDYCIGRRMGNARRGRRALMVLSVVIDLSVLCFFKYADFAVRTLQSLISFAAPGSGISLREPGIALPIGISFFTFQSMSYIFDLYRGEVEAETSYANYLTYISMFPQLIAGPIVRYSTICSELHERRTSREEFSEGCRRFAFGLFKKVLIANRIGLLFDTVRADIVSGALGVPAANAVSGAAGVSAAAAWLGAAAFTLQLYFDFSGYSDMAIGMGRMLGFHFNENFDYPLSSVSVTDFWRRWHISLSGWFRDYVYIPLGGNRGGELKTVRNLFIVWFLTGLWHGASWNFVLWGLWHFGFLVLEKYVWGGVVEKLPRALRHLYALVVIVTGFVIFALPEAPEMIAFLSAMFTGSPLFGTDFLWLARNYGVVFLTAAVLAFPVYPALVRRLEAAVSAKETTGSAEEITVSAKQTTGSAVEITESAKETTVSAEEATVPAEETTASARETTVSPKETTVFAKNSADPSAEAAAPAGRLRMLRAVSTAVYAALFLLSTAYLVSDTYNPFLYFRF